MDNLTKICNTLKKNEKMKNAIYELMKPYINLVIDKLTIYLIFFILLVAISFILHLGILIILIKYLNKK
tara:strand:+ start:166 stop:372 length:207 start_codon:yes stop_codon:yes gene_type:complete